MKNQQQTSISALILAGGKSTRMGQDKALLKICDHKVGLREHEVPLGGQLRCCGAVRPLLAHVCTVAQDWVNCVYVITPWTTKYQHLLPSSVQLIKENIILTNTQSNCPLIGFHQGLKQIETEWILLLACDLPRLNSAAIQQWCQYLPEVTESEIALLPRSIKGWEPLCGFYRRSCLPLIETYLNQGGRSFQQWLAQHSVKELPISDREILFNCNTREDWQKIGLLI